MTKELCIDKCEGCNRIELIDGEKFCTAYPRPEFKWKNGACPLATHTHKMIGESERKRVGQKKTKRAKERKT
jgi:hypothetical protein